MVPLTSVLARTDRIEAGIHPLTWQILTRSLNFRPSANRMRDALLALKGGHELLMDRAFRDEVIDLLRADEAGELCQQLGISPYPDAWDAARLAGFSPGSRNFAILCTFLDTAIPETEPETRSDAEDVAPQYGLFPHQRKIIEAASAILRDTSRLGGGRAIIHMPTGAGKTRTAMRLICDHFRDHKNATVVWLANTSELCDQAAAEFKRAWSHHGDRSVRLELAWGGRDWSGSASEPDVFLVAGLHQMVATLRKDSGRRLEALGRRTTLVVFDEAHMAVAPTYERVVEWLIGSNPRCGLLGLTATPGRTWNDPDEDRRLLELFRQRVTMQVDGYDSPVTFLMREGYLARPSMTPIPWTDQELSADVMRAVRDDLELPTAFIQQMASNDRRNAAILQHLMELASTHRRIIVFAASVDHAMALTQVAILAGICDARCVTGKTPPEARSAAIDWYQSSDDETRILVNFGVLTAGFDAPRTSACLIARPTLSLVLYSQMVGRALRGTRAGGNAHADVRTVVDFRLPGFRNPIEMFENWEDIWQSST